MPFTHAYTYDHNGNRLTQTVNGSLVQQFAYNGHDVLASGIGETEGYDLNGNLTAQTVNGQTTRFTWDDEDRLTGQQFPDGHTDTYAYNGLGMRLTKSDPTGSYSYLTDGAAPASDVLSDGHTSFTPGLSETNALGSRFYLPDAQGNSRGLLDASQTATDGYNWDAFGSSVSRFGSDPTAFAWNEESGYQSDGDSGLKLLGHRYYDSRTGRFISQDPAGDGGNWYAYADNDPMDEADPEGLMPAPTGGGMWSPNGGDQSDMNSIVGDIEGNLFSASNLWKQINRLFIVNYNPGVHAKEGLVTDTGTYQINWIIPAWKVMIGDDSITATVREAIRRSVSEPQSSYQELQDLLDEAGGTFDKGTVRNIQNGQKAIQQNYKLSDYIKQFRKGSVKNVFPKFNQVQNMTVRDVLRQTWTKAEKSTINKLLTDGRFSK